MTTWSTPLCLHTAAVFATIAVGTNRHPRFPGPSGAPTALVERLVVTELSAYEFSTLRDGAFTLSRGLADGLAPLLLVAPGAADRSLESLERPDSRRGSRSRAHGLVSGR
jgi:hypothetical protein